MVSEEVILEPRSDPLSQLPSSLQRQILERGLVKEEGEWPYWLVIWGQRCFRHFRHLGDPVRCQALLVRDPRLGHRVPPLLPPAPDPTPRISFHALCAPSSFPPRVTGTCPGRSKCLFIPPRSDILLQISEQGEARPFGVRFLYWDAFYQSKVSTLLS